MISTIMKISLINLRRDKVALMMTFVMPMIFFSIFAVIFGGMSSGVKETKIKVIVADQDETDVSKRFIQTLRKQGALEVTAASDEVAARTQVHDGKFPVAIIVLKGFSTAFGNFATNEDPLN
jgi:ABC-2 type transport system permease protein